MLSSPAAPRPDPGRPTPEFELLDAAGLERIGSEWDVLWRRCCATPFQSPAWLLPWARTHAPGRCGAAALRLGGHLEGLAPVFAWKGSLMLAGTGPSDHGNWLLAPAAAEMANRLLAAIADVPCGPFERIELRQLPPESPLAHAAAPPGWRDEPGEDEPCWIAPLAAPDGLGAASDKCRSNWRYAMRRIGREGGRVEPVPAGEAEEAISELARLHALRWRARGESGVVVGLLDTMLRQAGPALATAGLARLSRVRLGGRTIAVLLVIAGHGTHHYYLGGFDPAHGALSPSAALIGAAISQATREGASAFDFLRGAEDYKARWGAVPCPTLRRTLTRST